MWTQRDRVLATLSGEKADRPPIFECVAHDGILEHFGGAPIVEGDLDGVVRVCAAFLDLCHPPLVPRKPERIERADGTVEVRERWNAWHVPLPYDDGSRHERELLQFIEEHSTVRSESVASAPSAPQSVERPEGDMVLIHCGLSVPVLPFDLEHGALALADFPELVERWNVLANEAVLRQAEAVADASASPVAIIWNDIAAKGGLLYAPALLEHFFYPHLARLIDLLHGRGMKVLFHSDGNATAALPRLIACGIDGFNPLEIGSGITPEGFRDACEAGGRTVALVGGVDAVSVLAHGTPSDAARATHRLIDLFRKDGNLMVASASGEIDNSMPTDNVLAMYETVWNCRNWNC